MRIQTITDFKCSHIVARHCGKPKFHSLCTLYIFHLLVKVNSFWFIVFYSQHCSIPNVSHGPERRKRSSLGHRQVTHLHSFGHKAWRHVAWRNQSRELHQARLPERHADMRWCVLSGSKVWRSFYARSRVLFSKLFQWEALRKYSGCAIYCSQ